MTFIGSIASLDLVWNLADLFMAFLVLINISSIVRMGRTAGLALDDYIKQRKLVSIRLYLTVPFLIIHLVLYGGAKVKPQIPLYLLHL